MPLCPAIAYPHSVIDPALDDPKRNDGERLLRKLRPVWRSFARGDRAYLLDPEATGSLAKMVMGDATGDLASVQLGLLEASASLKPTVRLVAPSTELLDPEIMDEYMTTEQRTRTIPVRDSRKCAVLGWPLHMRPVPKIVVVFSKENFHKAARQDAEMEITRNGANVDIQICSFAGSRKRLQATVHDSRMLDRAFDVTDLTLSADRDLLPSLPNELPASIMEEVADFWQTSLRAHVLTAACQQCDNKSNRFVAFSRVTVGTTGKDAASKRTVLRATLHPSSAERLDHIHGMRSIEDQYPQCKFTNSKVDFTLSMCGRRLTRPSPNMEFGICPLHQGATPRVSSFPDICCHGTMADVSCAHFTDKREFKPGLWIRNIPLDKPNVLHVQALVHAAIRCSETVGPMIGKRKRDEIKEVCDTHSQALSTHLEQVNRFKACREKVYSADDLMRMDLKATDLLREGKVRQYRRPSTKELVLAAPKQEEDGTVGGLAPLTRPDSELNDHHLWLFKAPPRY